MNDPSTTADCTQAGPLLEGMTAAHLLADRCYDTNVILEQAAQQAMNPVIPPKRKRIVQRNYDKDLYKVRHLVENAVPQALARDCHPRCEKGLLLPCRCPNPLPRFVARYLVTTLSR